MATLNFDIINYLSSLFRTLLIIVVLILFFFLIKDFFFYLNNEEMILVDLIGYVDTCGNLGKTNIY